MVALYNDGAGTAKELPNILGQVMHLNYNEENGGVAYDTAAYCIQVQHCIWVSL